MISEEIQSPNGNLAQVIMQIKTHRKSTRTTLLITDERCLDHAGFDQYHNIQRRVKHKDEQPENAERLMILIDKDKGVLT